MLFSTTNSIIEPASNRVAVQGKIEILLSALYSASTAKRGPDYSWEDIGLCVYM